ncbi:hypothetical protein H4582DRAFT_122204 [Lactarius indigo]|nr:hypothetical protein H4582DRAFT_122204 [Lactarius indigo]
MSAIQTSLAILKEGGSLAARYPFIAPIAGLLLRILTLRDDVKRYEGECEIVMSKLARVARIIVNVCEKYNLSEGDLPASLRPILDPLQRELDEIERVLKWCSKRKGIKATLLRKDLLTMIKQCHGELSDVLQALGRPPGPHPMLIRVNCVTSPHRLIGHWTFDPHWLCRSERSLLTPTQMKRYPYNPLNRSQRTPAQPK